MLELALLVELEARWENLRKTPNPSEGVKAGAHDLHGVQQAYAAFRDKLVAYNKRYNPAHVPELLLNTPARLARWCRRMRDIYSNVEGEAGSRCPVHLLEKAYRSSERMSVRLQQAAASRSAPPRTIREAVEELGAVAQWCDNVAAIKTPA